MSLEPIKEVIDLFEGNFDYFQVFLSSYIPIAFAKSVGDQAFADGMGYEIEVPPSLQISLARRTSAGKVPTAPFRPHRNKAEKQIGHGLLATLHW